MTSLNDPRIRHCSEYHKQIKGAVYTLNFYPTKGTFYLNGATNKAPIKYDNIQFLIDIADGKKELIVATDKTERKKFKPSKRRALTKKHKNCFVCNVDLTKCDPKTITIEHIIPLAKGGSNRDDNLTVSCFYCNHKRKDNLSKTEEIYV